MARRLIVPVGGVKKAKTTHPTGDPSFAVKQSFPAAISAEDADPFLMCDRFGPVVSKGRVTDPDEFPINWHPHRGQEILTYMTDGVGRHADSLGNRGEFATPGMQWISVGSGVEHAEAGGTPAGQMESGWQIWINVPKERKMDDPRYGTEPPENIPVISLPGARARLLAGSMGEAAGPFKTVAQVQIVDYALEPNCAPLVHTLPPGIDNCVVVVSRGSGTVAGAAMEQHTCVRLNAEDPEVREFELSAGADGMEAMVFAGKRLQQPIAWHGPFVMCTDDEIRQTFLELRRGVFPPVRAPFDYKRIAAFPKK